MNTIFVNKNTGDIIKMWTYVEKRPYTRGLEINIDGVIYVVMSEGKDTDGDREVIVRRKA